MSVIYYIFYFQFFAFALVVVFVALAVFILVGGIIMKWNPTRGKYSSGGAGADASAI